MGAKTAISVEEYLHTSFPDLECEYRDGEVLERTLPVCLHGRTQALLCSFFVALRKKLSISRLGSRSVTSLSIPELTLELGPAEIFE
jgi:Uma2 family endonuclease